MRSFLRQALASFAGLALFFALGMGGAIALLVGIASRDTGPQVESGTILRFDLSSQIRETEPPTTLGRALTDDGPPVLTVRQATEAIEAAAQDDRIAGLWLAGNRGGGNDSGYAALQEVRQALQAFRESGKPIVAADSDWSEKEYYLGSVADRIAIAPVGSLEWNGFSNQQAFFAGALERLGIGIQVIRVGDYKSAVEPLTRQGYSPQNRQQTQALLGDLWNEFRSAVGQSRDLSEQRLQAIADERGTLLPEQAREAGLIDQVAYRDRVRARLQTISGSTEPESFPHLGLSAYAQAPVVAERQRDANNQIALIRADGPIVSGEGTLQTIGSERLVGQLRDLRQDEAVEAIVLRLNTPGGSAVASEAIWRQLKLARERKPVVVSMGNTAASGGYWIATGGSTILAQPTTVTGSIGVFGLLPNLQNLANDNGVTVETIETAELADITTVARPKTERELAVYQQQVERIYDRFLQRVARSRELSRERVAQLARGRVWSGRAAQQRGLVDRLGGVDAAIKTAAQAAELGQDWAVRVYPEQRSLEQRILEALLGQTELALELPLERRLMGQAWRRWRPEAALLATLNDPHGAYARLPFKLQIE